MSLKLISLNTWGGRAGEEKLLSFFKEHKDNADIFCLQEIWRAPYPNHEGNIVGGRKINHDEIMTKGLQKISTLLEEFVPHFRPHHGDNYGLLTLTKKKSKSN